MQQKLELKKKTVSVLSEEQLMMMDGGVAEEQKTTSFGECTGFLCCDKQMLVVVTFILISIAAA